MGTKIEVNETRRTVHFDTGERLDLHNVKWFDSSGTHLRIMSDEGFSILNTDRVLFHMVKSTPREDEAQELQGELK